jgi:AcrR family transcriptional regulator
MTELQKKRCLTREDWLAKALDVLAEEGVAAVRIEPLAEALAVTKGSFYWHFTDHDELLACLLEYWETEHTDRLADLVADHSSDPSGQLLTLLELVTTPGENRHDAPVRAWARHDPLAAAHLERVDQKRLDYVRGLLLEMGFSREEADLRSRWFHCYMIGECSVLAGPPSDDQRLDFARRSHRMLTAP